MESSETFTDDSHASYLKIYFYFGYYLGLCPYKFKLDQTDGKSRFRAHGHIFNKIICGVVHFSLFLHILGTFKDEIHPVPERGSSQTLTYYFSLAFRLCSILYYTSYFYLFWTKSTAIASLMDDINSPPSRLETKWVEEHVQVTTRAMIICSVATFLATLSLVMRFKFVSPDWDIKKIIGAYAGFAKFTFFAASNSTPIPEEEIDFENTTIAIFYIIIRFYSFLNNFFSDLLILVFALSFRSITIKFFEFIDTKNRISHHFVIQKYRFMKRTVWKINTIIGFTYSCGLLMTYPVNIVYFGNFSETDDDGFEILSNLFFAANFVYVLVVASGAVENVQRLSTYLRAEENHNKMSEVDFIVLLDELRSTPFGLQGRGLDVVTHAYVRNILSKFLSYTLLLILFQYTRKKSEMDSGQCPSH